MTIRVRAIVMYSCFSINLLSNLPGDLVGIFPSWVHLEWDNSMHQQARESWWICRQMPRGWPGVVLGTTSVRLFLKCERVRSTKHYLIIYTNRNNGRGTSGSINGGYHFGTKDWNVGGSVSHTSGSWTTTGRGRYVMLQHTFGGGGRGDHSSPYFCKVLSWFMYFPATNQ